MKDLAEPFVIVQAFERVVVYEPNLFACGLNEHTSSGYVSASAHLA